MDCFVNPYVCCIYKIHIYESGHMGPTDYISNSNLDIWVVFHIKICELDLNHVGCILNPNLLCCVWKIIFSRVSQKTLPTFVFAYISASWAATTTLLYSFMIACLCRFQNCPWINSNLHSRPRYSQKSALQSI